jgi:hypothetical protein
VNAELEALNARLLQAAAWARENGWEVIQQGWVTKNDDGDVYEVCPIAAVLYYEDLWGLVGDYATIMEDDALESVVESMAGVMAEDETHLMAWVRGWDSTWQFTAGVGPPRVVEALIPDDQRYYDGLETDEERWLYQTARQEYRRVRQAQGGW